MPLDDLDYDLNSDVESVHDDKEEQEPMEAIEVEAPEKTVSAPKKEAQPHKGKAAKETPEHLRTHMSFSDLPISRPLLRALNDLNFTEPTPIQRDAIPVALAGKDVMGTAETGSGKTAAFLLPILERLLQSPIVRSRKLLPDGRVASNGPVGTRALILLPTRELAQQCFTMLQGLSKYTTITSVVIAGGFESKEQQTALRKQPDIVVATPGRILDMLLNAQGVHLELLEMVVFDEADRLLELGFKEECLQILRHCSHSRQTLLFSATFSDKVTDLAAIALTKPTRVTSSAVSKVARAVKQEFLEIPNEGLREAAVFHLLVDCGYNKNCIVFFPTKQQAHRMACMFRLLGHSCAELHGNLSQNQRSEALQSFVDGEAAILFATDVAARGLDIEGVEYVINASLPTEAARYVHRVGRTARMGRDGKAITIYVSNERSQLKVLAKAAVPESKANDSRTSCLNKLVAKKANAALIQPWADRIKTQEKAFKRIIQDEILEKEERVALMEANRATNMITHKNEIASRPKKVWFQTKKEKSFSKKDRA